MKKTIALLGLLAIGFANAQQTGEYLNRLGINTKRPQATVDVREYSPNNPNDHRIQGVSLPNFTTAERSKFGEGQTKSMKIGTLIYNTTEKCIEMYDGYFNGKHQWNCLTTVSNTPSATLQGAVPNGVTLNAKTHYIVSVKDNEYAPFTVPTQPASWEAGQTNGNDPMIDIDGIITTNGINIKIPITVTGNGGTIGAYRQEIAVSADKSKTGNNGGVLILEWPDTFVTADTKFIIANLKSKNGYFYTKQLDLEKGLGNDYKGVVLTNFTYKSNSTNTATENLTVRIIPGIPDKKFGIKTNNKLEHQFIYLPVRGPEDRIWLNNNLGAEYANINSPYFSPIHQTGARNEAGDIIQTFPTDEEFKRDFRAYGYLYEFGRDSDGHEVITWTSPANGTFANPTLHNHNANGHNNPMPNTKGDPCPDGFHTPTLDEMDTLNDVSNLNPHTVTLRLPYAGYRYDTSSVLYDQYERGVYWSDTKFGNMNGGALTIRNHWGTVETNYRRTVGASLRCIAD